MGRTSPTPLREKPFRIYFAGRLVSTLGSTVAPIALAFAVLDLSGSATDLGLVLAAGVVPQLLFLLVGGVVADRLPRGRVLVLGNAVSGLVQAGTAAALLTGHAPLWLLVALHAVLGTAGAFLHPAAQGIVPQLVGVAQLHQANALLRVSSNALRVLGPAVGGAAVALVGPAWAIAWDAATYLAAAVVLGRLRVPLPPKRLANFLADLREGWSEFWSRTWLWAIVLQFSVVNAVWVGGFSLLGPVVADRELGGAASWGVIGAGLAVGLVAGGVLVVWWRPRRPLLVGTLGVLLDVVPLLALAWSDSVVLLTAAAAVAGVGVEVFSVCWSTALQERVPGDRLSRVSSYDMLFSFMFMPLGYLLAGPVAERVGTAPTLVACSAVVVVATLAVLLSRDVRTMRGATDVAPEAAVA
ncbi:MFS transporter [Saccharothrix longispora]|uniref:MFS transporter n=1 Tax=Saccharothrix longispora TaxID=33920 RepID=UPI0028FD6DB2|nr:MFS transporter [Saccharothrix longispora]MDU0288767.1 MFS transporter [Saccharothrix longispora]